MVFSMIDHISIAVRDLDRAARFYQAVLGAVGYEKLVVRPRTIGFGKAYPEF
jgi:catechol 2,3-dioxygenase-like lactoylglutathione lyase family enzyme